MSKDKFLIYLLTTTLIVPSFSTAPIANASDDHSTTPSSSSQQRDTQSDNDSTNNDDKPTKDTQDDDEMDTPQQKHEKTKRQLRNHRVKTLKRMDKTKRNNKSITEHKHLLQMIIIKNHINQQI